MAGSHLDKTGGTDPQIRRGGAVVMEIVNGHGRHSPDGSVRFSLATGENIAAIGRKTAVAQENRMGKL